MKNNHLSGPILRKRLTALGLTQQKVADKACIPLQSYQAFESGKRDIFNASFRIAFRVLTALEFDIAEFFISNNATCLFSDKRLYNHNK